MCCRKVRVSGLLKLGGKVYTKVIADASSATLHPIIVRKVVPDSIVYSDCWRGYNVLDASEFKHLRINHSKLFVDKKNHINGTEISGRRCPAGYVHIPDRVAKGHMRKFNGVPKEHFGLFLKECELRFNNPKPQA